MTVSRTVEELITEIARLHDRMEEALETVRAIRNGEVDALVVSDRADQERVLVLDGGERPAGGLLEGIEQPAALLRTDGTIVHANRRLGDLLGRPAEALAGGSLADFVTAPSRPSWTEALERARGGTARAELGLQAAERRIAAFLTLVPLSPDDLCAVVTDLSHEAVRAQLEEEIALRRRASAALQQRDAELAALHETVPVGLCELDRDGRVLRANARLQQTLVGAGIGDPSEVAILLAPIVARALETGRPVLDEEVPVRRGEVERCWLCSCAPVRGAEGEVASLQVVVHDITERQRAEQALRDAHRRKDEFLAMLAHELRNPLAPIRNAVAVLELAPPTGAEAARARRMIGRQVAHMARLVDDLLDVSRITRGQLPFRPVGCDLAAIVRATVDDYRDACASKGLHLEAEVDERIELRGDPTRLAQIVGNLLHNAHKFTEAGGTVRVRATADEREVTITVTDDGIGLEPDLVERVFDVFVQADRSLDRTRGGLGLGLALVRGLVALHGGTVRAASDGPGRGSEFTVILPREAPTDASLDEGESLDEPGRRLRILVVEDHADTARSLGTLLELWGHEVLAASTGADALRIARQRAPDLVLCDIGLPNGMSGYDVASAFRADPALAGIRLVALTGYGRAEDQRLARAAGFDRHMTKPVSIRELSRLIRRASD